MKKVLLVCLLSASLASCSLLQRRGGGEEEAEVHDLEPGQDAPLFDANGKEIGSSGGESEVARLNTKIAALETKLDVLTSSMERLQTQKSQPIIEAESRPQASLAAPVEDSQQVEEPAHTAQISAAPAKPSRLPIVVKDSDGFDSSAPASGAEKAVSRFHPGAGANHARRSWSGRGAGPR